VTSSRLRVSVTDRTGRPVPSHGLGSWLRRAAPASARGTVAIALVTDAAIRRLNREFRGKNHATDVLSFPFDSASRPRSLRLSLREPRAKSRGSGQARGLVGGDIAISVPTARRQARDMGHALRTELRVLALHGLLHLMGYDHETDRGQMQRTEEKLRRRSGLPAGLIRRESQGARR
jgi:probable rRNA maturation factor